MGEIMRDRQGREWLCVGGDRRWTLRSTGHSSARYGPCEVCAEHCPEVWIQSEQWLARDAEGEFWHYAPAGRSTRFGHEQCLLQDRANAGHSGPAGSH